MIYSFDGKEPKAGKETFISETATVIGSVTIGDNCYIGHGAILRGDHGNIEIGNGTAVEEGVIVHTPPKETSLIGNLVTIGHGAIIHSKIIGDYSVIGMGAILSVNSQVGEYAIVAEGAVVTNGQIVPGNIVVAGNPARAIREVTIKDTDFWKKGKQVYIDLAKKYLEDGMRAVD